jgi:hypothetical protein
MPRIIHESRARSKPIVRDDARTAAHASQDALDLVARERLLELPCARDAVEEALRVVGERAARHEHHALRHLGVRLLDPAREVHARHVVEHEVAEHHVELGASRDQLARSAPRGDHLHVVLVEQDAERGSDQRLVVDDEHAPPLRGHGSFPRSTDRGARDAWSMRDVVLHGFPLSSVGLDQRPPLGSLNRVEASERFPPARRP